MIFGLAVTFLVDRIGRRKLLIFSDLLMALGMSLLGLHFYLMQVYRKELGWLPLTGAFTYVAAYSVGWGHIPFIF